MSLKNKKVLIIIGGGIAAYKCLDLIRILRKNNNEIKTILTRVGENTKIVLVLSWMMFVLVFMLFYH